MKIMLAVTTAALLLAPSLASAHEAVTPPRAEVRREARHEAHRCPRPRKEAHPSYRPAQRDGRADATRDARI